MPKGPATHNLLSCWFVKCIGGEWEIQGSNYVGRESGCGAGGGHGSKDAASGARGDHGAAAAGRGVRWPAFEALIQSWALNSSILNITVASSIPLAATDTMQCSHSGPLQCKILGNKGFTGWI